MVLANNFIELFFFIQFLQLLLIIIKMMHLCYFFFILGKRWNDNTLAPQEERQYKVDIFFIYHKGCFYIQSTCTLIKDLGLTLASRALYMHKDWEIVQEPFLLKETSKYTKGKGTVTDLYNLDVSQCSCFVSQEIMNTDWYISGMWSFCA